MLLSFLESLCPFSFIFVLLKLFALCLVWLCWTLVTIQVLCECETYGIIIDGWDLIICIGIVYYLYAKVWHDLNYLLWLCLISMCYHVKPISCDLFPTLKFFSRHTFRGSLSISLEHDNWFYALFLQILVLSSNNKNGEIERTFYVSLMFCVLGNNTRNTLMCCQMMQELIGKFT